jgi:hydroxymethylbilane synthase
MNSLKKIRILSRKSDLALIQAKQVGLRIQEQFSDIEIEYISKKTSGDIDLNTPLAQMDSSGIFTDDLRNDLIKNKCDLVVHSWKDLPLDLGSDTILAGSLTRADQRDILFVKKNKFEEMKKKKVITIFSSSPRRIYNLESFVINFLPFNFIDVKFKNIRGNIPTRFKKFLQGDVDILIIAKAAIDRLIGNNISEFDNISKLMRDNISQCLWMITPLSQNPSSPGQGALGIEIRKNNKKLLEIVRTISDPLTMHCVNQERKILQKHGGGCHQKIGVSFFPTFFGLMKSEKGETDDGKQFYSWNQIDTQKKIYEKITEDMLYPSSLKNYQIFQRKQIDQSILKINNIKNHCIWIARKSALPEKANISSSNIIWTSGITTWKNLAKRGVWINGTSDGMGEDFNPNISNLASLPWIKLTHSKAPQTTIKNVIATYELIEIPIKVDLNTKKFFYWMSATAFNYALRENPNIINAIHSCGPGNTYKVIKKVIRDSNNLEISLSFKEWKKKLINKN